MLKSLRLLEKIDKQIYWKKNVGDYPCFTLSELKEIKQYLEFLQLLIKWKNMIHFKPDPEFLNDEEYNLMVSELKLIENYLKHHFGGYLPKCFRKEGDNHD